jgi:hypothetical protein
VRVQTESDLFDIVYPRCGLEEVQLSIDDQIPKLMSSLVPVAPDLSRGQITLSFYEKRVSKKFFGMSSTFEKVYWEQWQIRLIVNTQPREPSTSVSAGAVSCLKAELCSCSLACLSACVCAFVCNVLCGCVLVTAVCVAPASTVARGLCDVVV